MDENSRIRFNPYTGEVEIAGSEKFIETNLNKLLNFISAGSKVAKKTAKTSKLPGGKKTSKAQAESGQRGKKKSKGVKSVRKTMFNTVVDHILASKGITTSELKDKTGLTEKQIWSIIYRAVKMGVIKIERKGIYKAAA